MLPTDLSASWRPRLLSAAARRHRCLSDEERVGALAGDAWLLSRAALPAWAGTLVQAALLGWWLTGVSGLNWWLALLVCLPASLALTLALVQAWFQPHGTLSRLRRQMGWSAAILVGAALVQVALWKGGPGLWFALAWLLPAVVLAVAQAVVAQSARVHLTREMQNLRLVQERDAAARQAAEARLALLQAQVQPHFIFNTLAALQHWVDEGDARAAPLLRSLTGFLRGSTELLAQDAAPLGAELPLVRHYLAVMQARLGERLRAGVDEGPGCAEVALPPGLLLTLVENAVEHGAAARLQGGEVQVRTRREAGRCLIEVSDNGPGLAPGWREGVGLANARERLAHRFGPRARLRLETLQPGVRAVIEIDLQEDTPHGR